MKAYLATTGLVFALLTFAHLWRMLAEGLRVAANPWFIVTTLLAASLAIWAWRLLRRSGHLSQRDHGSAEVAGDNQRPARPPR